MTGIELAIYGSVNQIFQDVSYVLGMQDLFRSARRLVEAEKAYTEASGEMNRVFRRIEKSEPPEELTALLEQE